MASTFLNCAFVHPAVNGYRVVLKLWRLSNSAVIIDSSCMLSSKLRKTDCLIVNLVTMIIVCIFIIILQAMLEDGIPHEIVSKIHLVDLAGRLVF